MASAVGSGRRITADRRPAVGPAAAAAAEAIADGARPSAPPPKSAGASVPGEERLLAQLRSIAEIADVFKQSGALDSTTAAFPHARQLGGSNEETGPNPSPGRWGDLVLIEEVGAGTFGTVYRAYDPTLDQPVAVKLLHRSEMRHEDLVARLLAEGRLLAKARHPNVVTIYGAAEHGGRAGLWMEFIRGLTLEQMLASHGPFSAAEAALIGRDVCQALAAVHHAGLVHRDVKAQNVMRQEGGRFVLMDFGAGGSSGREAADGRRVGTPLYMAPEVCDGRRASVQSDIYSTGVLLYHLVTGSYPVTGTSLDTLRRAHRRGSRTPLLDARPDVPREFAQAVERAIDPDPARRYASASQFGDALARLAGVGESLNDPARIGPGPKRPRAASLAAGETEERVPSVAVLPFSDMSAAKDQEPFCDGLTIELISALSQIPELRVAARASAFQFKGQAQDIRLVGKALNVATVLDGSVRRWDERLRVTVELISAADGYHLWSQTFDRPLADARGVQEEIAASVVRALKGRTPARARSSSPAAPPSPEAYRLYLQGRYHWSQRTEDELAKSVRCFEAAIAKEPTYGVAYAGLGDAYATLATYGALRPKTAMPRAARALSRALELEPDQPEALTCRGTIRSVYEWAWDSAEQDFRRAIEINPLYSMAHHWCAINHFVPRARFDEARLALDRALDADPLNLAIHLSVGLTSYFAEDYKRAARELTKTLELDARFGIAHLFYGATLTEQRLFHKAAESLDAAVRLCGRTPDVLAALGYLRGRAGDSAGARAVRDELVALAKKRYVSPARLAQVHAGLGEVNETLACLEAARRARASDLAWVAVRPMFADLRGEPRFQQVAAAVGVKRT